MWKYLLYSNLDFPKHIDKDTYNRYKQIYYDKIYDKQICEEAAIIGWVGFMASFRGKFFDGCYSGHDVKGRDYIQESINNIEIQRANIINHHDVIQFTTSDYKDFAIPNNSSYTATLPI